MFVGCPLYRAEHCINQYEVGLVQVCPPVHSHDDGFCLFSKPAENIHAGQHPTLATSRHLGIFNGPLLRQLHKQESIIGVRGHGITLDRIQLNPLTSNDAHNYTGAHK